MNKKLYLTFFISGILGAVLAWHAYDLLYTFHTGETKVARQLWIAKNETVAYAGPFDENILYEIKKGEGCTLINILIEKSRFSANILCKDGEGWVHPRTDSNLIQDDFDIIKASDILRTIPTVEKNTDFELWIAKEETLAYPIPPGKQNLYKIKKGEECMPTKTLTTQYLSCPGGEGWILDKHQFRTIQMK
jgi:hypothetical protein